MDSDSKHPAYIHMHASSIFMDKLLCFVLLTGLYVLWGQATAISGLLVCVFALAFMESSELQASPGKLITKLSVETVCGRRISFIQALLRQLFTTFTFVGLMLLIEITDYKAFTGNFYDDFSYNHYQGFERVYYYYAILFIALLYFLTALRSENKQSIFERITATRVMSRNGGQKGLGRFSLILLSFLCIFGYGYILLNVTDQPLDPEFEEFMSFDYSLDRGEAYLYMIGINAAENEDPYQKGLYFIEKEIAVKRNKQKSSEEYAEYRKSKLQEQSVLLKRYRRLYEFEDYTYVHWQIPLFKRVIEPMNKLTRNEVEELAAKAEYESAFDLLKQDTEFWQSQLKAIQPIISKVIGSNIYRRNLQMFAYLMKEYPGMRVYSSQLIDLLNASPLSEEARLAKLLQNTYKSEFQNHMLLAYPLLAVWFKIGMLPNLLRNNYLWLYKSSVEIGKKPPALTMEQAGTFSGKLKSFNKRWWFYLYNPLGNMMFITGVPDLLTFTDNLWKTAAYERMLGLSLKLRSEAVSADQVVDYMQTLPDVYLNPFYMKPFDYDAKKHQLSFPDVHEEEQYVIDL